MACLLSSSSTEKTICGLQKKLTVSFVIGTYTIYFGVYLVGAYRLDAVNVGPFDRLPRCRSVWVVAIVLEHNQK